MVSLFHFLSTPVADIYNNLLSIQDAMKHDEKWMEISYGC
jgi:hypothetical protein